MIEGMSFQIVMINSYFDSNDFVNPVKHYIDSSLYDYIMFDFTKQYDIYMTHNTAETQDSQFSFFGGSKIYNFLSLDKFHQYFRYYDPDFNILTFTFFLSNKTNISYRSSLTIFDILGITGGFSSVLMLIFGTFVNFIVRKMYVYNLNASLYQVDALKSARTGTQTSTRVTMGTRSKVSPLNNSSFMDDNSKCNISPDLNDELANKPAFEMHNFDLNISKTAKLARIDIVKRSMESMSTRRLYNYTFKDI